MTRKLAMLVVAVLALGASARAETPSRAQAAADAITELDVEGARKLLEVPSNSPTLAFERARLAIYLGDCDTAAAILAAPDFASSPETTGLTELAKSCARATAGAVVIENKEAGLWFRLQDEADRALVPFLTEVAVQAREQVKIDLGVELPRPLRIDLVRDLFTLSAVSGLPVAAAENTGTVAVARWGRVTMLSPRATQQGYPWEDTLAHEITHLALSRATRDRAPLWLQEGIAKRQETRWRKPRPFDQEPAPDAVAQRALLEGRSVGVDKLGPSIAMLPTPEAASIAFSEVTSFMDYWVRENGTPALHLLLTDLKGLGSDDASASLRSVTGYDLAQWIARWQTRLRTLPAPAPSEEPEREISAQQRSELPRRVRLGDLLFARGESKAAAQELDLALKGAPREGALRWRAARAHLAIQEKNQAESALGKESEVRSLHGGYFALTGRLRAEAKNPEAETAFRLGIAVDPLLEDVACEGNWTPRTGGAAPQPPKEPNRRQLCLEARKIPRD
jgi:hypothetical protein